MGRVNVLLTKHEFEFWKYTVNRSCKRRSLVRSLLLSLSMIVRKTLYSGRINHEQRQNDKTKKIDHF